MSMYLQCCGSQLPGLAVKPAPSTCRPQATHARPGTGCPSSSRARQHGRRAFSQPSQPQHQQSLGRYVVAAAARGDGDFGVADAASSGGTTGSGPGSIDAAVDLEATAAMNLAAEAAVEASQADPSATAASSRRQQRRDASADRVTDAATNAVDTATDAAAVAVDFAADAADTIIDVADGIAGAAQDVTTSAVDRTAQTVSSGVDTAADFASTALEGVYEAAGAATAAVQGAADTTAYVVGAAAAALTGQDDRDDINWSTAESSLQLNERFKDMKVLVVGATGGVGRHVVQALRARGVACRALVRDRARAANLLPAPSQKSSAPPAATTSAFTAAAQSGSGEYTTPVAATTSTFRAAVNQPGNSSQYTAAAPSANRGTEFEIAVGDVYQYATLPPALAGCNAVIVASAANDKTDPFAPFNVDYQGTRNLIAAAKHAGVKRFVFVTSIGADDPLNPLNLFWGVSEPGWTVTSNCVMSSNAELHSKQLLS
eukprot:GHRR01002947.1.p1 GENE.GHRR01002947.1~~GHRR01002947.1.p1  ORF type:complete len:488 (+),score=210.28 GHRR01002947.1:215-1678(+)